MSDDEAREQLVQVADMLSAAPEIADEVIHRALGDHRLRPAAHAALRGLRDALSRQQAAPAAARLRAAARELSAGAALADLL